MLLQKALIPKNAVGNRNPGNQSVTREQVAVELGKTRKETQQTNDLGYEPGMIVPKTFNRPRVGSRE